MSKQSSHKSGRGQQTAGDDLAARVRRLVDAYHEGSVNAAAADIGIPQRSLARIAGGEVTTPRLPAIQAIARYYLVSVGWLLEGEGDTPILDLPPERLKLNLLARRIAGDDPEIEQLVRDLPNAPSWAVGALLTGFQSGSYQEEAFGKSLRPQIAAASELSCQCWRLVLDAMAQVIGYGDLREFLTQQRTLVGLGFSGLAAWATIRRPPGSSVLTSFRLGYEAERPDLPDHVFSDPREAGLLAEFLEATDGPTEPPLARTKGRRAAGR